MGKILSVFDLEDYLKKVALLDIMTLPLAIPLTILLKVHCSFLLLWLPCAPKSGMECCCAKMQMLHECCSVIRKFGLKLRACFQNKGVFDDFLDCPLDFLATDGVISAPGAAPAINGGGPRQVCYAVNDSFEMQMCIESTLLGHRFPCSCSRGSMRSAFLCAVL